MIESRKIATMHGKQAFWTGAFSGIGRGLNEVSADAEELSNGGFYHTW